MLETNLPPPGSNDQPQAAGAIQLTDELIKKIANKVYALMMEDAKIGRERRHFSPQKSFDSEGGRHGA
jgi:hypothetical protein